MLGQSCPKEATLGLSWGHARNLRRSRQPRVRPFPFHPLTSLDITAKFLFTYTDNLPQNVGKNIAQELRKSTSGWHAFLKCLCQSCLLLGHTVTKYLTYKRRFGQFWLSIAIIPHWQENSRANGFTARLHTLFKRRIYWYCSENTVYHVLWENYKLV